MLSAVYSNVAQDSDGYWTPNYRLFTPLINDDGLSLIIGPLLKRDLPKIILVSKRFRALYQPCLQSALKDPVNARLEAAFALILAPPPPQEASKHVFFHRHRSDVEDLATAFDLLVIVASNVQRPGPVPYFPMVMGLVDFGPCSFVIKIRNFICSLKYVDIIHSRDSIPLYDGVGEDPQDRGESCFGDIPDDGELKGVGKWLLLKLNGRRWVGVYTYYSADQKEAHNCMFAFRRTAKGAYSALLLIRDVISHIHSDICPPIPPLFRE
jgi:hypothetical protein